MSDRNIRLTIAYDGTRYLGWQKLGKPGDTDYTRTIQGKLETLLGKMTGENIEINGSGRTDAGVHAVGQTASFHTACDMSPDEIRAYMNRYLPNDIAVLSAAEADPRFHARLHAKAKTYRYRLRLSDTPDVFCQRFEYTLDTPLDLPAMEHAAALLCGEHDFRNFCSSKRVKKSTVRTVYSIDFVRNGEVLDLLFRGSGFLYNMVRILTGTLLEVGMGQRDIDTIPALFDTGTRSDAGYTAPAQGLTLLSVEYEGGAK